MGIFKFIKQITIIIVYFKMLYLILLYDVKCHYSWGGHMLPLNNKTFKCSGTHIFFITLHPPSIFFAIQALLLFVCYYNIIIYYIRNLLASSTTTTINQFRYLLNVISPQLHTNTYILLNIS